MHPTVSQYREALQELTAGASQEEAAGIAENFFGFLKRRGEEKKMDAIVKSLERSEADKENRVSVTVVTAFEADRETKAALAHQAEKLFSNKKIELRYEVDREMIGGALFRTDERLYDATLSNEVRALKNSLLKA